MLINDRYCDCLDMSSVNPAKISANSSSLTFTFLLARRRMKNPITTSIIPAIMVQGITITMSTARGIQIGDKTHHQDQLIQPKNFRMIKTGTIDPAITITRHTPMIANILGIVVFISTIAFLFGIPPCVTYVPSLYMWKAGNCWPE